MLHRYYVNIAIKYKDGVEPLTILPKGDWVDLRCAEDTTMKAGEFKYIPLGVAMELPVGCEAIVVPRSSTLPSMVLSKLIASVLSTVVTEVTTIGGTFLRLLCVTPLFPRMTVSVSSVYCLISHLFGCCRWKPLTTLIGAAWVVQGGTKGKNVNTKIGKTKDPSQRCEGSFYICNLCTTKAVSETDKLLMAGCSTRATHRVQKWTQRQIP